MGRTPGQHELYFKTKREKIKVFPPRKPRSLVLNTGTILQVSPSDPCHRDRSSCGCISLRRKRTLVTLVRGKANHQRHRGVCVNTATPSTPTNTHDKFKIQVARIQHLRISSFPLMFPKNPRRDLDPSETPWGPSPLLMSATEFAHDSLLDISLRRTRNFPPSEKRLKASSHE